MKNLNMSMDILGSDGKNINIMLDDMEVRNHILNPTSFIECIVDQQINTDKIYDFYFKDKKDLVVVDAGANVGMFSVHCSPSSKIIYSIEPTPSHFNLLKKITKKFKNIIPINCALWNKDENLTFYNIPSNTTSNTIVNYGGQPMTVTGKTLQTIIKENNIPHIDLLKMDIEGSEFEILNDEFINYCYSMVDNWFVEVHAFAHYCSHFSECQEKVINMFKNNKYKVDTKGTDGLFIYK